MNIDIHAVGHVDEDDAVGLALLEVGRRGDEADLQADDGEHGRCDREPRDQLPASG